MQVRTGEPSDAPFVVEMARFASVIEDLPLPPADDPGLARGLPPSPDTAVLAIAPDGHRIGAAWWHFREPVLVVTPDGAQVPELVVAVTPAWRGRGVGRALLDALTDRAAERGYARLALNVHIRNPAVRLYSRAGFVVAGKGRGLKRTGFSGGWVLPRSDLLGLVGERSSAVRTPPAARWRSWSADGRC